MLKWLGMGLGGGHAGLEIPAGALSVMSIYKIDYIFKVFCPAGLGKGVKIGPCRLVLCKMSHSVNKQV